MASMIMAIIVREEPDAFAICFDEGGETFRHQENETYKEGRSETPDDFYDQIPRVMELVDAFGFIKVSDPQYEADDFLGSYAKAGEKAGMRVTVVTGDHDAFQLASEQTRIAIPHKGYSQAEYLGPYEVEAKLGIRPDQVASYKGLSGDSSDNLPGVHGIGPKTASKLLQQYQTLDGMYEHLSDIKQSIREKLERDRDQAFFCERMAELACEIPLPASLEDISVHQIDPSTVLTFFTELDFTLLTKRFLKFLESDFGQKMYDTNNVEVPEVVPSSAQAPDTTSQLSLF
jgi:DNA polymerase-1